MANLFFGNRKTHTKNMLSGTQLKQYLKDKKIKESLVYKQLGMSRQLFAYNLALETVSEEFLQSVANGIDVPVKKIVLDVLGKDIKTGIVSEPEKKYGEDSRVTDKELRHQTAMLFGENAVLHRTLADRAEFIAKLLKD